MLSVEEACKRILDGIRRMPAERVPLAKGLGRVLAEPVASPLDHPPWDTSSMDGYAVRSLDVAKAGRTRPRILKVVEEIAAGARPRRSLSKGEASKIMTGAPLPPGADAVVRVEESERRGGEVALFSAGEPGRYIRKQGLAIKKGEVVIREGTLLRPFEIAMAAAIGRSSLRVSSRPKVAILATGDELAEPGQRRRPQEIYDSNSWGLAAQVSEAGGIPRRLGIARDTRADLAQKLARALSADCILAAGGVSMGDFDFVREALERVGAKMDFWKVAMQPGQPLAFGRIGGKPAFGLPGNPVSALVTFEQFVRPALLSALGRSDIFRPELLATLEEDLTKPSGRKRFVRGVLTFRDGRCFVRSTGDQDSSILQSLVKANCLIVLPEMMERAPRGAEVTVQCLF